MSLPAIPWEIGSALAKTVGGELVHPKGEKSVAVSGFGCVGAWLHSVGPFLFF